MRKRNDRLTPRRRRVLEIVAAGHRAIGAYDIVDGLRIAEGYAPAPISVYRALQFLVQHTLVHRVKSLNAYAVCLSAGSFHVCRRCRTVAQMKSPVIEQAIAGRVGRIGGNRVRGRDSRYVSELCGGAS